MISFLPDTVRNSDGSLTVDFGTYFPNAVLILKRTVFDGMKQEEEEITIEVEIRQLMAKTMAAATAPTPRTEEQIQENIGEWKALGTKATTVEPTNYPYANCSSATELTAAGFDTGATSIGSDVCLISLETVNNGYSGTRTFPNVQDFGADLPSLKNGNCMFYNQRKLKTFTGETPNITNASYMFSGCTGLTSWSVALPNSLTNASYMFTGCTGLTSWSVALPNSLTDASSMFSNCSGLTSWSVALPDSLTNVSGMFWGCSGLTSFSTPSGTLPNTITQAGGIVQMSGMFSDCSKLESFTVSMPTGLKSNARYMFYGCKLNLASVKKISETIAQASGTQTFTLGIAKSLEGNTEVQGYLEDIRNKGWTVEVSYNA